MLYYNYTAQEQYTIAAVTISFYEFQLLINQQLLNNTVFALLQITENFRSSTQLQVNASTTYKLGSAAHAKSKNEYLGNKNTESVNNRLSSFRRWFFTRVDQNKRAVRVTEECV